jgi:anti-sigma28 factor (negative regulator of flagellin synthesis)
MWWWWTTWSGPLRIRCFRVTSETGFSGSSIAPDFELSHHPELRSSNVGIEGWIGWVILVWVGGVVGYSAEGIEAEVWMSEAGGVGDVMPVGAVTPVGGGGGMGAGGMAASLKGGARERMRPRATETHEAAEEIADDLAEVSLAGELISMASRVNEVRFGRVAALRQAIEAGTYGVGAGDVAEKVMEGMRK